MKAYISKHLFVFVPSKWNKEQTYDTHFAPLENIDLEPRLKKEFDDVNSFNNLINSTKEMITYIKDENHKLKKKKKF